ncbi:MAG TPA: hypothetical protein VMT95_03200 [Candidatus Binatia bacterium]|nr:hypothetical protein [Candidatus Binatia bacterium]
MNSFLGAIRNGHLVLMLVSAAVLLFALSPNEVASLRQALTEATALRSVDYAGLPTSYIQVVGKVLLHNLVPGPTDSLRTGFAKNRWQSKSMRVDFPLLIYVPDDRTATLQEIYEFFSDASSTGMGVEPALLKQKLEWDPWKTVARTAIDGACVDDQHRWAPCRRIPSSAAVAAVVLSVTLARNEKEVIPLAPLPSVVEDAFSPDENVTVFLHHNDVKDGLLHVYWFDGPRTWSFVERVPLTVFYASSASMTSPATPQQWLRKFEPDNERIVFGNSKEKALLSELRLFWNDVSLKTPAQAVAYLQDRIDNSRQSISLFGLTVDQRVVLLVGPIAILIAALYLLSLLQMFVISLKMSELPNSSIESYPWVGLFSNPFSIVASTIAILILPPVASSLLVIEYWGGIGAASVTATAVTVVLVVVSLLTGRTLTELRPRFASATLSVSSGDSD